MKIRAFHFHAVSAVFAILGLLQTAHASPQMIDGMYVNTFGRETDQPIIYVHGGPGYNSHDFEITTAEALAAKGYFVVVYDERGQGRSQPVDIGEFNYRQYSSDLKEIIDTLHLSSPILMGHSHGGPIVTKFDQAYPGLAKKIILVSGPINFWDTIASMHENCASTFTRRGDTQSLQTLAYIHQALFSPSISTTLSQSDYTYAIGSTFSMGLTCGLHSVKDPTPERTMLMARLQANPLQGEMSGATTAMPGFLQNENYVHLDNTAYVTQNREHFCGIYGDEDGLFSPLVRETIQATLNADGEPNRFVLIRGASHSVFVDQQEAFFDALKNTCGI